MKKILLIFILLVTNSYAETVPCIFDNCDKKYSEIWPNITEARPEDVPSDAKDWNGVPNKYEEHFSEKPGKGD